MRQKRANEEGTVDVLGGTNIKAAAPLAPAQTGPSAQDQCADNKGRCTKASSSEAHQLWSIHIDFSSATQDRVADSEIMPTEDKDGGGASTPRDIPEYVQRHFKLNKDLRLEKIEKEPGPGSTVYPINPRKFSSSSPPDLMDVDDLNNVLTTASPAKSMEGEFDREANIDEQGLEGKPASPALPLSNTLQAIARAVVGDRTYETPREPVHATSMENSATQEAPSGSDHAVQRPTKSKLQQYADEVYQNTVVKYKERVRRGEEKLTTDRDRRANRMWFERYGAWMAKQKQAEQQAEQQKLQGEGLPTPFPKPNQEQQEHQDEGLPAPFPPPQQQRKGG